MAWARSAALVLAGACSFAHVRTESSCRIAPIADTVGGALGLALAAGVGYLAVTNGFDSHEARRDAVIAVGLPALAVGLVYTASSIYGFRRCAS